MLLLYAVTRAGVDAPPDTDQLRSGRVSVLFRNCEREPAGGRRELLEFADVIEEAARSGPVLPMRYGTTVTSRIDLCALADRHEPAWTERLEAVAGHRELVVHLPATEPERLDAAEVSGREYLRRRARELRRRQALQDELAQAVAPWVRERRLLGDADPVRVALLVPEGGVAEVRAAVYAWASARDTEVPVTGPWPPFSFCDEGVA